MTKRLWLGLLVLLITSCQSQNRIPETPSSTLNPVETHNPETNYQPAFEGQTRVQGIKTTINLQVSVITDQLSHPWAISNFTQNRFLVTQKQGSLVIVNRDGTVSQPIEGFPVLETSSQAGLLDVVMDPNFNETRKLYFTFSEKSETGSVTAVGHGRLSEDERKLENFQIIYRALPYYQNGLHFDSRLVFDTEGNIFVSTGERSSLETRQWAQELGNGYGKIIHITSTGKPVATEPISNSIEADLEIYSYGHRNVQGLAIHPKTNQLYASEMGPKGGDELNLIEYGKNYGWPLISYGLEYSGQAVGKGITQKEGLEQPVYYWDPVIAPSGMTFYDSEVISEWKNNLFIAALKGSHIARLVIENNKVVAEERLLESLGQRFRDVESATDGSLVAITDEGRLYRIGK